VVATRGHAGVAVLAMAATLSGCATAVPGPATVPPGPGQPDAPAPPAGRIAFARLEQGPTPDEPSGADLWSVSTDGSDLIRLTDLPELELFPGWSPDAGRLVFSRLESLAEGDLWVIDADPIAADRHLRQLTEGPGLEAAAAWSPDGAWIAYVTDWHNNASIWIRAADGSGEPKHVIDGNWPSWTPDGSRLLVTLGSDFKATTLAFVSVDGGEPETLPIQAPNASEGSVSSLGEIAFVSSENDYAGDPANWNEDIYTVGLDGRRGPTRITDTPGNDHWPPTWSPAGDWFAYTHDDAAHQRSRIAIVVGTGEPRYLTDGSADLFPAWRPDPSP
jgi:Tol biopolymer transport system component